MKGAVLYGIFLTISVIITAESVKIKDPRIINGDVAEKGQFPWQVGVVALRSSLVYYCGGAIIGNEWILTAAHCIYEAEIVTILYGTLDLEDTNANFSLSANYIIHEDYDNTTLRNDIGLVQLDTPLTYDENLAPVFLAPGEVLDVGAEVTVSGWGATNDDDTDERYDVLRYIIVNIIDNEDCVAAYGPDVIHPGIVCTGPSTPVKNPCKGDGGDPAVLFANSKPTHVGIFSFLSNLGCENPDFPAGFIRTSYYREWITSKTGI